MLKIKWISINRLHYYQYKIFLSVIPITKKYSRILNKFIDLNLIQAFGKSNEARKLTDKLCIHHISVLAVLNKVLMLLFFSTVEGLKYAFRNKPRALLLNKHSMLGSDKFLINLDPILHCFLHK